MPHPPGSADGAKGDMGRTNPLLVVYDADPGQQEFPFRAGALYKLGGGDNGHPLLNILSGGVAFTAEQVEVLFCGSVIVRQTEQKIGYGGICGGIALVCV